MDLSKTEKIVLAILGLLVLLFAGVAGYFIFLPPDTWRKEFPNEPIVSVPKGESQKETNTNTDSEFVLEDLAPWPATGTDALWDVSFDYPYPVSWISNFIDTDFDIAGVSVYEMDDLNTLKLFVKINTRLFFCTSYFESYMLRRLINERGDLAAPKVSSECVQPNSTDTKEVDFEIPKNEKEIIIQVFDHKGNIQTYFTVKLEESGKIMVEPALRQG